MLCYIGKSGNVFRIKPPMCITDADIQFTAQVLDVAFKRHYERKAKQQK